MGLEWWIWMGGFFVFTIFSMVLLAKATQTLPLGTAYPVWTGIGAVGTVLVGIFVFHEPATFWRLFFISTLLGSIIGLKNTFIIMTQFRNMRRKRQQLSNEESLQKELESGFSRMLMIRFDIEHLTGKEAIELVKQRQ